MKLRNVSLTGLAIAWAIGGSVIAQQPAAPAAPPVQANPTPGCSVTPAQLEANRKLVLSFFVNTGDARVALADPGYIQHNPQFKKRAEEAKQTDFEEFKGTFGTAALEAAAAARAARAGGAGAPQPGAGGGRGPGAGPQAPPGNQYEVVTAECDIVTVIHKQNRPDPVTPGRFFEAFTFDAFRVKNGKLVEHWDTAVIAAPPAAPGGAPAGAPPARGN